MAEVVLQQDFQTTLQKVVKQSFHQGTLAKGLHEVCKALEVVDAGKAKFCVLAENCDEQQYTKLVKALCKQNQIPLLTVPKGETLGEWVGLAKYDLNKAVRKARKCSSLVVRNYPVEITEDEKKLIADELNKK